MHDKGHHITSERRGMSCEEAISFPTGDSLSSSINSARPFSADVAFTRDVESELDKIANGHATYLATVQACHDKLNPCERQFGLGRGEGGAPRFPCPMRAPCAAFPARRATLGMQSGYPPSARPPGPTPLGCASEKETPHLQRMPKLRQITAAAAPRRAREGYDFWGAPASRTGCKVSFPNKRGKPDFNAEKGGARKKPS